MDYDRLILEIDEKETLSTRLVKKAYRRLLKKYHPDLNNNDLEYTEKIIGINDAYQRLLGRLKPEAKEETPVPEGPEGLVRYKDQAYAFYKQGFLHFDKITATGDIMTGLKMANLVMAVKKRQVSKGMQKDSEAMAEVVSKQLYHSSQAIYYFSIVRNEFSESDWAYDAHEKILHIKKYLEKNLTMIRAFLEMKSD